VVSTGRQQRVYHDQEVLFFSATLLHPTATALRWSNQMRGDGADYYLSLVDHSTLALRRVEPFLWERTFLHLPTVLYLEAVNDGVGTTVKFRSLPGRGVDVATVFERPVVQPGDTKLFRTESPRLHLQGRGFTQAASGYPLQLQFNVPLKEGGDYKLRVVSRTDLFLELTAGAAWSATAGPLFVIGANTAGGAEGWVWFAGEGVQVAHVQSDPDEGAWVRQALWAGGAVLLVGCLGLAYRRSARSAAAGPTPVQVRYQKVPGSEGECEMSVLGGGSAGAGRGSGLVPASEVIVCADADDVEADLAHAGDCSGDEKAYPPLGAHEDGRIHESDHAPTEVPAAAPSVAAAEVGREEVHGAGQGDSATGGHPGVEGSDYVPPSPGQV
jgi:hypothetical protein